MESAEVAYDADNRGSDLRSVRNWSILLLIYKSTLTMRRDDQLFLDDASSHMHAEQTELLAKVNRLNIPMRILSVGSGVFLLVLVAMWLYQKLSAVQ